MPAKSKNQQRFFGMARAVQKGTFKGEPSKELRDAAYSMSTEDINDFAKTKHKGLPKKVKKSMSNLSRLKAASLLSIIM